MPVMKLAHILFLGTEFINSDEPANLGKKVNVEGKKTTIVVVIPDLLKR